MKAYILQMMTLLQEEYTAITGLQIPLTDTTIDTLSETLIITVQHK